MKQLLWFAGLFFCLFNGSLHAQGGKFDFLDKYEVKRPWTRETVPNLRPSEPQRFNLSDYYDEFTEDGRVPIYVGIGYEAYYSGYAGALFSMLKELATHYELKIDDFAMSEDGRKITFTVPDRNIAYQIDIGDERNAFMNAFANHEVVIYHGHSRYGRGPAFGSYWNYYRMGSVFPIVEVDVRNSYFLNEPMQDTYSYRPTSIVLDGIKYFYQYQGGKDEGNYLPDNSYTKRIPGYDRDFRKTRFWKGRQLYFFYSCSNVNYFKKPIRRKFPDKDDRFIFGTKSEGYWGEKPLAVFIMSVVRKVADSTVILDDLTKTNDCGDCFTTY